MNKSPEFDWEKIYEDGEDWGDTEASEYVVQAAKLVPKDGKILDAGCGVGRNSRYLATLGFEVEAFDISAEAVKQTQKFAMRNNLAQLTTYQANLIYWQSKERYDFIIIHGVLNSLPPADLGSVIAYLRTKLKQNGLVFISIFHPLPSQHAMGGVNILHNIDADQITIKGFFDCSVERHDIRIFSHAHRSLSEHTHCIERFLLRRSHTRAPLTDA